MMQRNGKTFVIGAVVGGVLGAVTALLLAPKSGKELRADISEQAGAIGEKTTKAVKAVGVQASEWAGKAKGAGVSVINSVKTWRSGNGDTDVAAISGTSDTAAEDESVESNEKVS
jgi:gas vesicle protein